MATNYDYEVKKYENLINRSKTANNPGIAPTKKDLALQSNLLKAQSKVDIAENDRLKEQWYGEKDPDDGAKDEKGYFGKFLHTLGAPMYGVIGGIEAALGKGTKKGLANIKANIDEEGCYDVKTEVLTKFGGWKFFKDLNKDDEIATLNPKNDELEYQKPSRLVEYKDKKELVVIKNRAIDIAVTKNHNMWVSTLTTKNKIIKYKSYRFIKAKDLPNTQIKIQRNCKWNINSKSNKSNDWFAFMGLYLAEGCLSSHGKGIFLSVSKPEVYKKTKKLLSRLNYKFSERKRGDGFEISQQQELAIELKKLGTAHEKYIPNEIKFANKKQIKIFLKWFGYGDAHERNGWREFYSCSKRLIDDIQECLIKIGHNGNINIRDRRGKRVWIKDHWANCNYLSYELNERVKKTVSYINGNKDIFLEKYNGSVYCAEVPNHIMLVRRNGKAYFCGNTAGDLLRSYNIPNLISMPLGLALDITLDPINWATMGTSALIPRTAFGAYKGFKTGSGALRGLKSGVKSGLLNKAETAARFVPGVSRKVKDIAEQGAKGTLEAGPFVRGYKKIMKASKNASEEFDAITETTFKDVLLKQFNKVKVGDKVKKALENKSYGPAVLEMFKYSPDEWFVQALEEAALKGDIDSITKLKLRQLNKATAEDVFFNESAGKKLTDKGWIQKDMDESASLLSDKSGMRAVDSVEVSARSAGEAERTNEYRRIVNEMLPDIQKDLSKSEKLLTEKGLDNKVMGLTEQYMISSNKGVQKRVEKVIRSKNGRKMLDSYAKYIGTFKNMKIGLNPATWMNAIVGNLAMTYMAGINALDPRFLGSMKTAAKIVGKQDIEGLMPLLKGKTLRQLATETPDIFRAAFGMQPELFINGERYIDDLARQFKSEGRSIKGLENVKKNYQEVFEKVKYSKEAARTGRSSVDIALSATPHAGITGEILGGSRAPYGRFMNMLKEQGESGNSPFAKAFYNIATKSMEGYGKIDQTYRLGLALHLADNGISEAEVRTLSKIIRLDPSSGDIVRGANNLYQLSPRKAMETSLEVYMNYLAMPGFVKAMRTLPVAGFPFIAFSYAMGAKAGKTALRNTAIFNKVNFLMKEISGEKSPLEKQALAGQYYGYFNKPGMMKLPWFKKNPVYLNMENMLPWYTMNAFQPSERSYKSQYAQALTNVTDKLPFFKSPEGQLMLDYFVLPLLIQNEQPKGQFNQPLWTKDAGIGEKAARAGETLIESVLPPIAGLAGLAVPYDVAKYMPLGYRFKSFAGAKEGKSALGITSQEPAAQRTLRKVGGMAGFPTYQMMLKNQDKFNNK